MLDELHSPPAVRESLADLHARLRARFGERLTQVRLFGSHARGDFRPDSDVDVLVVVKALTRDERREIYDLAEDVNFEWQVPLATLVWSSEYAQWMRDREFLIVDEIDTEGVAL
jgi:predicted nucleotidyltransferase